MIINDEECAKAELDPRVIARLGQRLERVIRDCTALGIQVFGGTGSASLRFDDHVDQPPLILAELSPANVSGGDGAIRVASDGYERAES